MTVTLQLMLDPKIWRKVALQLSRRVPVAHHCAVEPPHTVLSNPRQCGKICTIHQMLLIHCFNKLSTLCYKLSHDVNTTKAAKLVTALSCDFWLYAVHPQNVT